MISSGIILPYIYIYIYIHIYIYILGITRIQERGIYIEQPGFNEIIQGFSETAHLARSETVPWTTEIAVQSEGQLMIKHSWWFIRFILLSK